MLLRKRKKINQGSDDLNLIPIMNLVLVLIPVVLYQTQLVKIGVVDIESPKMICCASPIPSEPPLGLSIQLNHQKGFILSTTAQPIGELIKSLNLEFINPKNKEMYLIPKIQGKTFDFKTLYKVTSHLKVQYPQSHFVILTGTDQIEFKYFIHTMDVIRSFTQQDFQNKNLPYRNMWDRVQFALFQPS